MSDSTITVCAKCGHERFLEVLACNCREVCGDDGDIDGPGTCKGLRPPPLEPLVQVVVRHRDEGR